MPIPTTRDGSATCDASCSTPSDAASSFVDLSGAEGRQDHEGLVAPWSAEAGICVPGSSGGASYATHVLGRVLGGDGSVVVAVTTTPHIAGDGLRVLSAVDVRAGKVVRWVDYWDSSSYVDGSYWQLRTPAEHFPRDCREVATGVGASERITDVATRLQAACGHDDAGAAGPLFDQDAVLEDMGARVQVVGRAAVTRYLARVLAAAPFGAGSALRHVLGGDLGGGFEWRSPSSTVDGITALELDAAGLVTRMTVVHDSRHLGRDDRNAHVEPATAGVRRVRRGGVVPSRSRSTAVQGDG